MTSDTVSALERHTSGDLRRTHKDEQPAAAAPCIEQVMMHCEMLMEGSERTKNTISI